MRIRFISLSLIFIFCFLFVALFNLTIFKEKSYKVLSHKNCIRLLPQVGSRGRVLDRHGNTIVDNYLSYDVMIMPQEASQIDKALMRVARILDLDMQQKDLRGKFKNSWSSPFVPVTLAENINIRDAIALEELKFDLPGIIIQLHPQRGYPQGKLASHVLGYLGEIDRWRLTKLADYGYKTKDIVGFSGVEEKYDYYLRQEEGGLSVEVDYKGRFVRILGFKPPHNGKDIQLTLDLKIQGIVEEALGARRGSVIIMEPSSGEIIALASSPGFHPSAFVKKSNARILNLFNHNPDAPLVNRAISAAYPAGSVFKIVVATAAIETGKINLSTTFFCPGNIRVGRQEFSCWNSHNQQNLLNAITHSCNVFFYRTGLLVGAQAMHDYALKFGLARPTGVDLPYEAGGFVPDPLWRRIYKFQNWFDGDTANLAIGQGELLVTPLQMACMMAVFANKGMLVRPYILRGVDGEDMSVYQRKISPVHIKENTINYIRQGLKNVVFDPTGTANILSGLTISVAGKTGTAQVSRGQPHGWFVGFLPFKNPKFVICVFLENGGSGYASCVLAKEIIGAMVKEGLI
jgi:penicillin-binding protein 2